MFTSSRSFAAPLALSAAILCVAPVWGTLQEKLKTHLGAGFALLFGALFLLSAGASILWALRSIRTARLKRYSLIFLAAALAAIQVLSTDRGLAEIPERMHLVLYGLLAFLFYRNYRAQLPRLWFTVPATILAVTLVGLLDEIVQVFFVERTGELYDVSLNVFAGALGCLVSVGIFGKGDHRDLAEDDAGYSKQERSEATRRMARRRLMTLLGLLLLAFGLLFDQAHLGYRVEDPELGTFYTYVRPDQLEATNQDRAERWSRSPPGPDWKPLELQDDFRIEVGWRIAYRNSRIGARDWFAAWREQLILERYFWSFLDSTSRRGDIYVLPPQDRETLRVEAETDDRKYSSPVGLEPKRIYAWPGKRLFWMMIASGILTCVLARRRL